MNWFSRKSEEQRLQEEFQRIARQTAQRALEARFVGMLLQVPLQGGVQASGCIRNVEYDLSQGSIAVISLSSPSEYRSQKVRVPLRSLFPGGVS